jgi:hypothetical protein
MEMDVAICKAETDFNVNSNNEREVVVREMGTFSGRDVDLRGVGVLDPGLFSIDGQREICWLMVGARVLGLHAVSVMNVKSWKEGILRCGASKARCYERVRPSKQQAA